MNLSIRTWIRKPPIFCNLSICNRIDAIAVLIYQGGGNGRRDAGAKDVARRARNGGRGSKKVSPGGAIGGRGIHWFETFRQLVPKTSKSVTLLCVLQIVRFWKVGSVHWLLVKKGSAFRQELGCFVNYLLDNRVCFSRHEAWKRSRRLWERFVFDSERDCGKPRVSSLFENLTVGGR